MVPLWFKKLVSKDERLANFLKNRHEDVALLVTKSGRVTTQMRKRLTAATDLANITGGTNLERIEIASGKIIAVMRDGTKFFVKSGQSTTSVLFYYSSYEEEETNLMRDVIKKGWTVLDAGANFGWYTAHFSQYVGDGGKVFAFEPIHSTFEELKENVVLNHVSNATVINRALGERECETSFFVPSVFRGSGVASEHHYFGKKVPVKMTTLDVAVEEYRIGHIDLIKADIEGGEFGMLRGGGKTLEKFHPRLLLEVQRPHTERFGYEPKDVFDFLAELGYRAFAIGPDGKLIDKFEIEAPEVRDHSFYFAEKQKGE